VILIVSRPSVPPNLFKAQTCRDHAKARDGLQLPLFGKDNGAVGGEGEA
jgi:hypothetical protein